MILAASINVTPAAIAIGYASAFFFILAVTVGVFDWICDSVAVRYNAWVDRRNDADHVAWWSLQRAHVDTDGWGR